MPPSWVDEETEDVEETDDEPDEPEEPEEPEEPSQRQRYPWDRGYRDHRGYPGVEPSFAAFPLSAPTAGAPRVSGENGPGDTDELFRAWQG